MEVDKVHVDPDRLEEFAAKLAAFARDVSNIQQYLRVNLRWCHPWSEAPSSGPRIPSPPATTPLC